MYDVDRDAVDMHALDVCEIRNLTVIQICVIIIIEDR